MDVKARTPSPNEYGSNGQYAWNLEAAPVDPSSFVIGCPDNMPVGTCGAVKDFTVTIIKPDADPVVELAWPVAEDYQQNRISSVTEMERLWVLSTLAYSLPAGSTLTVSLRNNPASYTKQQSALLQADGWVPIHTENFNQGPADFKGPLSLLAVAPSNVTAAWHWDLKIEAKTSDNRQASMKVFLDLPVTEPQNPWAQFDHDQSGVSYVQPGHNLLVTMVGNYIFPGASTGSLSINIRMISGAAILGGAPQTIPNLKGKGGFSQTFFLTAPANPPVPGAGFTIVALLHLGTASSAVVDTMDFHVTKPSPANSVFCKITTVQVNGNNVSPPQDVTQGKPFTVQLGLQWQLVPGSEITLELVDPKEFASDAFSPSNAGSGSWVDTIQVPAADIPPQTGLWNIQAQVYYTTNGVTVKGGSQSFAVNIVGASGGGGSGGGPPGPSGPPGSSYDWAITGISTSPVNPSLGSDVTFTAQVGVTTSSPLPQTVAVAYSIDGVKQSKGYVTYQPGMAFLAVSFPPWTPTLGQHTVSWVVDPDMQFNDPNRANNMMKTTFTVTATPPQPPSPPSTPSGQTQPQPSAGQPFDFYVTAVPMEQTIDGPATYVVTVNSTAGTPQTVQLDLQGAPAGVSYYFTPPSGMPGFTSTLIVTAASTVPAGSYPLTINATAAGIARYASLLLDVMNGPDYSLAVTPDTVQASPGGTASFNVTVTSNSSYGQLVNLDASDLPPGSTAQFNPSALAPNGQSTLTVQLSNDAAPGFYTITVTGSGVQGKQVSATVLVQGQLANPEATEATVNYLAMGILAAIVAVVIVGVVLGVRRLRAHRVGAFCIGCGTRLRPDDTYCEKCGTKQTGDA
jgi:hypothetical protein